MKKHDSNSQSEKNLLDPDIAQFDGIAKELILDPEILARTIAETIKEFKEVPLDVIRTTFIQKSKFHYFDENGEEKELDFFVGINPELFDSSRIAMDPHKRNYLPDIRFLLPVPDHSENGDWKADPSLNIDVLVQLQRKSLTDKDLAERSITGLGSCISQISAKKMQKVIKRVELIWVLMNEGHQSDDHRIEGLVMSKEDPDNINRATPVDYFKIHITKIFLKNTPGDIKKVGENLRVLDIVFSKKLTKNEKEELLHMMNVDLSETAIRNMARFESLGTQLVEETWEKAEKATWEKAEKATWEKAEKAGQKKTNYSHIASMLDRGCDVDQIAYLLNEPIELVVEVQKKQQNEKD